MAGKMIDLNPDLHRFMRAVKNLSDNVPQNGKTVLRNECRLMLEDIIKLTKPKSVSKLGDRIKQAANIAFMPVKKGGKSPQKIVYNRFRFGKKLSPDADRQVQKGLLNAFIKIEKGRIGQFAASWMGDGNPLRASRGVPGYVKRHVGKAEGSTKIDDRTFAIKIEVVNSNHLLAKLPGIHQVWIDLMNRALKVRSDKTKATLRNLLKYGGEYKMPKAK